MDDDNGIEQWRWWGGRSMAAAAFEGDSNGLRLSDGEAKMAIDTSGGGWRQWVSAFDGGDGRRWPLVFDGGAGQLMWHQWTVDNN